MLKTYLKYRRIPMYYEKLALGIGAAARSELLSANEDYSGKPGPQGTPKRKFKIQKPKVKMTCIALPWFGVYTVSLNHLLTNKPCATP